MVYGSTLVFGFIHLMNYKNDGFWFFIFSPLIILTQIFSGMIISFIRVKFNLLWSIFYHSLWNLGIASIVLLAEYIEHS